jgi:hypothetical protein
METVVQVLEAGGKLTGDCSFLFRCLAAVMTTSRTKPSQVNQLFSRELASLIFLFCPDSFINSSVEG